MDEITELLEEVDWDSLMLDNVDSSWAAWKRCFLDIMNQRIPQDTIKTNKSLPWMCKAIIQAIQKGKALF